MLYIVFFSTSSDPEVRDQEHEHNSYFTVFLASLMYCLFYECKLTLINNNTIYFNRNIKILDCRALGVLLAQGPSKLLRQPCLDMHSHESIHRDQAS